MLLVILSAVLGILAFPPSGIYPLGFVFLVPLFIFFIKENKLSRLLLGTFVFKLIFSVGTTFFIFEPFLYLLSIMIFLGLPVFIFFVKKLIKFLVGKYFPRFSGSQSLIDNCSLLLLLPFLWTFFDFLQAKYGFLPTYIITAGNIFGSSPFLGLAGFGGLITLAFFAALINSLAAFTIMNFSKFKFRALISALCLICLIFGGYFLSKSELKKNALAYEKQPLKLNIALVSANKNFDQDFWVFKNDILSPGEKKIAETLIVRALNPLKTELQGVPVDFLVLPKDMIDIESDEDIDEEARDKFGIENAGVLIRAYRALAQELNVNLITTLTTVQNGQRYVSTVVFNREGDLTGLYNKFNLTVVGEYWPFGDWRPFYYNWAKKLLQRAGQGETAVLSQKYAYQPGQIKVLEIDSPLLNLVFGSAICNEIQYPWQMKKLQTMGAKFIAYTTDNKWAVYGLKSYLKQTDNLRKIEAVWLGMPILINGREEMAGIITPDGKMESINFESQNKDFGIFIGEIKLK